MTSDPRPARRDGPRCHLRQPQYRDESELRALRRASWAELEPWEPTREPDEDPCSAKWFRNYLGRSRSPSNATYLLVRNADNVLLGHLGLGVITRGALQSAYAGYWVGTPFRRQGWMTQGLGLLLEVAFVDLGLHRLEANIRPENEPSLKLAARVGFQREGYSPKYLHIDGAWCDHERWAVLSEDWLATRDAGS
ncbi:MAG: GNAT family protein [Planctomycetota bacterium]